LKTQAVVTAGLLFCGVLQAQSPAGRKTDQETDESILRVAESARQQIESWVSVAEINLIERALTDEHTEVNLRLMQRLTRLQEAEAEEVETLKKMGGKEMDETKTPEADSDAVKGLNAHVPRESGPAVKALLDKIDGDEMRESEWESSAWSPRASALLPGESIGMAPARGQAFIKGTVRTALARGLPLPPPLPKPDEEIMYVVYAPLEIRSLIAMEGLRHGIASYSKIVRFNGRVPEYDPLIISWKPAWFDAEAIYCKYNPGAKFTNLNGEEQTCTASSAFQSKTHN